MARPKKAPRERLQITLPKPQAAALRKWAKKKDRDISDVVSWAVRVFLANHEKWEAANEAPAVPVIPLNPEAKP